MTPLKFAVFGAGFWSRFQLAAWKELEGAECVAVYNRTRSKAEALAHDFGIPAAYNDPEALIREQQPDFIDVITDVDTHAQFVHLAAAHRIPVICQKPMAPTLEVAEAMVAACREAGVPFFVHENWRWQTPIREAAAVLNSGIIGAPFRARIDMVSGFPVFKNQPFLAELEQFILTDMGSHLLDVARFLFGEARSLYCQTHRVHPDIRGEDVASVMMRMGEGTTVVCNMGYAENYLERDRFPETFLFIEGAKGSLELGPDYWLRITTGEGTHSRRVPPSRYPWADPAYDVVQSSIVPCNADFLKALRGEGEAETTGEDNLKTARLVFGAYESAAKDQTLHFS
ncbi:MAG: Gfo/Idh/MocA family oxidoreductase [Armatimonadetes bacterium]|nr:Gfo/Idh/MocA family oxidoreductase [Armatimonadota bacterium]